MTEVAALGLKVDSSGVVQATADLKGLETQAGKTERAADKLSGGAKRADEAVKREGGSARKAANDNRALEQAAAGTSVAMHKLAAAAGALVGSLAAMVSIGAAARMADEWSDMQSVVGAAIKDMEAAPAVMQDIVRLANASYSSLEQTARGFSANVNALRDLGLSTQGALDYTEALNHALVITATRGDRAASVQHALSKAMAVGRLQAEGLETVLANGGRIAEALADELGTTVSGLREMSSQGRITGAVIANALTGNLEDLRREAAEMPATMADAFTRMQTNLTAFVGQLDKALGVSERVAGGIMLLADNVDMLAGYAAAAAIAITALYIPSIWGAVAATAAWVAGLVTLKGALIATGIGAFIVLAGTLIGKFLELVRGTGSFGEALSLLWDVAKETFTGIVEAAGAIPPGLNAVWQNVKASFLEMIAELTRAWGGFLSSLAIDLNTRNFSKIPGASGVLEDLMGAGLDATRASYDYDQRAADTRGAAAASSGEASAIAAAGINRASEALGRLRDVTVELGEGSGDAADGVAGLAGSLGDTGSGAGRKGLAGAAGAATGQVDALGQALDKALRQGMEQAADAANRGADAINGVFTGLLDGSKSLRQGISDLIMEIAKMQMMDGFRMLFGAGGAFEGVGGWLGGLLGGARANGGPVQAGVPYLVNERTPNSEVFVPSRSGAVLNVPQAKSALSQAATVAKQQVEIILQAPEGFTARQVQQVQGISMKVVQGTSRRSADQRYLSGGQ